MDFYTYNRKINNVKLHKVILPSIMFSVIISICLIESFDTSALASTVETVPDEEVSNDGWDIVNYCHDSLNDNYFQPGYSRIDCDVSMLYFNEYCNEKAFYTQGNICTSQSAVNKIYNYIEQRDLQNEVSLGYYYPITFD
jgi:hypothetical protein